MRLNLGCGGQVVDGWVNLDRSFGLESLPQYAIRHDLREPLPFQDDTASTAVMHHVLDMFDPPDVLAVLAETYRVLKDGGTLRLSFFDVRRAAGAFYRNDRDWFLTRGSLSSMSPFAELFWMIDQGGARKWIGTPELVGSLLDAAGFKVNEVAFHETTAERRICELDSREDESFYIEGTKP